MPVVLSLAAWRLTHVKLDDARNHDDRLRLPSGFVHCELDGLAAVGEQPAAQTALILDHSMAATVLADQEDIVCASFRRFGLGLGLGHCQSPVWRLANDRKVIVAVASQPKSIAIELGLEARPMNACFSDGAGDLRRETSDLASDFGDATGDRRHYGDERHRYVPGIAACRRRIRDRHSAPGELGPRHGKDLQWVIGDTRLDARRVTPLSVAVARASPQSRSMSRRVWRRRAGMAARMRSSANASSAPANHRLSFPRLRNDCCEARICIKRRAVMVEPP